MSWKHIEYKEFVAILLVIVFAFSLFIFTPRQYLHVVSYKYAVEAEKTMLGGSSGGVFYEFTRYIYALVGGADFDRNTFDRIVKFMPVLLGLGCVLCFYFAARTRLGSEVSVLGAVFLACSPAFMINSLAGVFTPELFGVALFSISLFFFLASDMIKQIVSGVLLSALAGIALGVSLTISEAGLLMAIVMVSSAVAQLIYYVKEGDYRTYAARFLALLVPTLFFVPYAKHAAWEHMDFGIALNTYVVFLPFLVLFLIVAIRDLIQSTKRYELFFLAISVGSAGIALFDPFASAPGIMLGVVFGVKTILEHRTERAIIFVFLAFLVLVIAFVFAINFMTVAGAFSLSLLIGFMLAGVFLLYDNENIRNGVVIGGTSIIVAISVFSGVLNAQREYVGIEDSWGKALIWARTELPADAVIGTIGPKGVVDYLAQRRSCNCDSVMARYLLSGSDSSELKKAGVTHLLVDVTYLSELDMLARIANITNPGLETYFFSAYFQDQQTHRYYAYLVSKSGKEMMIPVELDGTPNGGDVLVSGVGAIRYENIRRFGDYGDRFITGASKVVIPLYGERNNLFTIYFDDPEGLELVYPTVEIEKEPVRIYRVV